MTPLKAYRGAGGSVVFSAKEGFGDRPLVLRCGQCLGCRIDRSREWALRCVHEASLHERNCFVTLTYRGKDLPRDLSLDVRHWQLFAKRLRKRVGRFRFLHCGEYGDTNLRPHYHACLFGVDFSDRELFQQKRSGNVYSSKLLEELWGLGFCTVGDLTWQSAGYVARYTLKKVTGPLRQERLLRVDAETGEEWSVRPEYVTMSRRPGLAAAWFDRYQSDVFPDDEVVHDGKRHAVPDYYMRRLEVTDPEMYRRVTSERRARSIGAGDGGHSSPGGILVGSLPTGDLTAERLEVREEVLRARMRNFKREV